MHKIHIFVFITNRNARFQVVIQCDYAAFVIGRRHGMRIKYAHVTNYLIKNDVPMK